MKRDEQNIQRLLREHRFRACNENVRALAAQAFNLCGTEKKKRAPRKRTGSFKMVRKVAGPREGTVEKRKGEDEREQAKLNDQREACAKRSLNAAAL